ncbi:MAG: translation initiation factor IF-2 subunit beta [Methanomicrobiaceae archaeon]|nr:translation initiation factor IF-2 subunit beta [Methanomicrobiaceae archaeon]
MVDPYEELLKQAYSNITEISGDEGRFTVPEPKVYIEGKTTVFENFTEIATKVRRDQDHLMKFLVGELGTAGKIDGNRAIFNGKFERTIIESAIRNYIDDYVICSECGKPDTRLIKDGRVLTLRCDACGGHRPVKKRRARTEPVGSRLEEGAILDVDIESLSRRGDGVARIGKYTMYVAGTKPGQTVKVKITRVAGSIVFTQKV